MPQSRILAQASDPRIPQAITGLKGTLQIQMENIRPFNTAAPARRPSRTKSRQLKSSQRWSGSMVLSGTDSR